MLRRDFLRYGGAGLLAGGSSSVLDLSAALAACNFVQASCAFSLSIGDVTIEMIDGKKFRHLGFRRLAAATGEIADSGPRVPGPVLRVVEGQRVTIRVQNNRPEPHGFHIAGAGVAIDSIAGNGGVETVTFTAPVAGTYMYHDPSHRSRHLYRVLGLHGVMVVHPLDGMTREPGVTPTITPYSMDKLAAIAVPGENAALTISQVFNSFGRIARFPGGKWVPAATGVEYGPQERIWLFHEIDPDYNLLIQDNGIGRNGGNVVKRAVAEPSSAAEIVSNWTARYFTINGKSGFDLSEDPSVVVKNYIGEPTLLRTVNTGLCHHSAHIHGNHVLQLAHSYVSNDGLIPSEGTHRTGIPGEPLVHDNVWERDTWPTWPMQTRDVLLPFEVPPDIPTWSKFEQGTNQEPFPIRFVMHDHCEMGTTAAGGNYPQGAVTHWEIKGPLQRRPA